MALKEFHTDVDFKGLLKLAGTAGTVGQVLVSGGASGAPSWSTASGASPVLQYDASLAENVTLTAGYNGLAEEVITVESGYTLEVPSGSHFTVGSFDAVAAVTAGAGLTKVGSTLDVGTASASRIVVNADSIDLATTGVGAGTYNSVTVDTYGRVTAGSTTAAIADATANGKYYVRRNNAWVETPIRYVATSNPSFNGIEFDSLAAHSGALSALSTGTDNIAFGYQALFNTGIGSLNIAIGSVAGREISSGNNNVAIGYSALRFTTTASDNVAVGYMAGRANTTGYSNVCLGSSALYTNTTGYENVGIGGNALQYNTTGFRNIGIGYTALQNNTTGDNNVAIGRETLKATNTGYWNTAIGSRALISNTTGYMGTSVGFETLFYNVSGLYNTAVGFRSLHQATNNSNTGIGTEAGYYITSGANNTCIGIQAGTDAVANLTTQSNYVVLGNNSTANANIKVAWTVTSDARDKCRIAPCPHGLAFVSSLAPVRYEYRQSRDSEQPVTDGRARYGFLAQDILALEGEEPVIIDDRDPDSLKFTEASLIPVLVNAIQELSAQVSALTARVAALEAN